MSQNGFLPYSIRGANDEFAIRLILLSRDKFILPDFAASWVLGVSDIASLTGNLAYQNGFIEEIEGRIRFNSLRRLQPILGSLEMQYHFKKRKTQAPLVTTHGRL